MEKCAFLSINNISVSVLDKPVLKDILLSISSGEVHAIMGPNGSGKSSLAYVLMGHPHYAITAGIILLNGENIADIAVHERAKKGLFLAFQHPLEIPGVSVASFLKEAYSAKTGLHVSVADFQRIVLDRCAQLAIDPSFITRGLNVGFSGGEKKKLEILQLLILRPDVAILDEIDSGLDVDALNSVADGIEIARQENPAMAFLVITHYQRIFELYCA